MIKMFDFHLNGFVAGAVAVEQRRTTFHVHRMPGTTDLSQLNMAKLRHSSMEYYSDGVLTQISRTNEDVYRQKHGILLLITLCTGIRISGKSRKWRNIQLD